MAELTQPELEALEVAAQDAWTAFRESLIDHPQAYRAWLALRAAEHALFEARRGRRESEAHE